MFYKHVYHVYANSPPTTGNFFCALVTIGVCVLLALLAPLFPIKGMFETHNLCYKYVYI